jgi:hypothetical protein
MKCRFALRKPPFYPLNYGDISDVGYLKSEISFRIFAYVVSGRSEQVTSCAGHRTRQHCALSAMLTVSQLSKSFAGQALFDDVSLQVNRGDRIKFQSPIH